MARTQYVRSTKPLTAEAVAVLMLLTTCEQAVTQIQLERATGPRGDRVSIGEAVDFLEGVGFIRREQPPPKTAKWIITDEGEAAIAKHKARAIRELKDRVARMQAAHPRDKSVMSEENRRPFERLLVSLETDNFQNVRPRHEDEDDEDTGPVEVVRPAAIDRAKRQRDQDQPSPRRDAEPQADPDDDQQDPELSELSETRPAAKARSRRPAKGRRGRQIART